MVSAELPLGHVLAEIEGFEASGKEMSGFLKDHFANIISYQPQHPYVVAFANRHGLVKYLSQPAA